MDDVQIDRLKYASRAAMAWVPDEEPPRLNNLVTATLSAISIVAACAVMLVAVL